MTFFKVSSSSSSSSSSQGGALVVAMVFAAGLLLGSCATTAVMALAPPQSSRRSNSNSQSRPKKNGSDDRRRNNRNNGRQTSSATTTTDSKENAHRGDNTAPSSTNDVDNNNNNNKGTTWSRRLTLYDQMMAATPRGTLTVQPIGVVRSVYKLCVGTPRQGLLAPDARGCIELSWADGAADDDNAAPPLSADAVQGLQDYSHIWIVFVFHLNTVSGNGNNSNNKNSNNNSKRRLKIAPPALGGAKVGVLASRSPHRPNPIGMTLAKLDRIVVEKRMSAGNVSGKQKQKPTQVTCLYISGLDLVEGTPVLDIKPHVPVYDTTNGGYDNNNNNKQPTTTDVIATTISPPAPICRVPDWVADGLQTFRPVTLAPQALEELRRIVMNNSATNPPLAFYGGSRDDYNDSKALDAIQACITQVLSMDVRSPFQTNKVRAGHFQAERSSRIHNNAATATTTTMDGSARTTVVATNDNSSEANAGDSTQAAEGKEAAEPTTEKSIIQENVVCTQQLDNLLISYIISATPLPNQQLRRASTGSGAEDTVHVVSIRYLPPPTPPSSSSLPQTR